MTAGAYDPVVRWGRRRLAVVVIATFAVAVATLALLAMATAEGTEWQPYIAKQFWVGSVMVPVGAFVSWQRPDHRLGWLFLVAGTCVWLTFAGQPWIEWLVDNTTAETLARVVLAATIWGWIAARGIVFALVPLCYPGPRPAGRVQRALWATGVVALVVTCVCHARLNTFELLSGAETPTGIARVAEVVQPWSWSILLVVALAAVVTMLGRVARLPAGERRRHLPFAVTAALLILPGLESLYGEIVDHESWVGSEELLFWTTMALPLVLSMGILLHGLLDIGLVARRSTVYALTLLVLAALYGVVVWASTTVVTSGDHSGRILATGIVALAVVPVHVRAHRLVDEQLFGRRHDPAAVLSAIGTTVENAPQGERALALVADTVRREMRVPFVAVDLSVDDAQVRVATSGEAQVPSDEDLTRFALNTPDGPIGDLVVARRTPQEPFGRDELSALRDIARHVAVLATNVALTEQLRTSRRQLVEAREEERRRIRRDLHDGLGPTLASVCLGLGAAGERIGTDTDLGALLGHLEDELRSAVDDIRRLVYDLRPPALDELGLIGAVRDHVAGLTARTGEGEASLTMSVDGETMQVELPAAVEVAAYRIALEAITNVTRHALARHCWVRFHGSLAALEVVVEDDGCGLGSGARQGVGLRSMRDRAAELGGELLVASRLPSGTLVRALLPLGGPLR